MPSSDRVVWSQALTQYVYDGVGGLLSATLPDSTRLEYVIDARGRRVGKKRNGNLEKGWLYDGQLRIVAELDGTGAVASRFIYGTLIHSPDVMLRGGVAYRYVHDVLGSVRLVINIATGQVAQRIDYDSWGVVTSDSSPGFQPFGFAGGLFDVETRLTRFGARDYDPATGRWLSKDPVGFAGRDGNLYGYARGRPLDLIDPTGETADCTYSQATGQLTCTVTQADGGVSVVVNANGYAGRNVPDGGVQGRNNPTAQCVPNVGPIPQGNYSVGTAYTNANTGVITLNVDPLPGTNPCGRSQFRIHGNNVTNDASEGCIIMPPSARTTISNNGGGTLRVVP